MDDQYTSVPPATTFREKSVFNSRPALRRRRVEAKFLLHLGYPLKTPREVANEPGLERVPELEIGDGENGQAHFCHLDESGINSLGT